MVRRGPTASRQTEEILREMVLDGTLAPGERLNEVTIAEGLGVSRGPLREAIQKLAGEGLLLLKSHRGAFVRTYEPQEIIEIYEMRIALELYATRLAIQRASDAELADLGTVLVDASPHQVPGGPSSAPYVAELDFHARIMRMSGNSAIASASAETNSRLYIALTNTERTQARREHAGEEHRRIFSAMIERDEHAATALLEEHLEQSLANTLAVLGLDPEAHRRSLRAPLRPSVDQV